MKTTTTTTREAGLKFKENKYALYCTLQCYLEKYFVHQQDSSFPDVRLGGHKLVEKKMGEFTSIPGAPTINMGNSNKKILFRKPI